MSAVTPADAQLVSSTSGTTVNLTSTTANCNQARCYLAANPGSAIDSNNNPVNMTGVVVYGAWATNSGTVNLADGGDVTIFDGANGLQVSTSGSINATGLNFTTASTTIDTNFLFAATNGVITLDGTTSFASTGYANTAILAQGGTVTVNGPIQGSGAYVGFAAASGAGSRVDFTALSNGSNVIVSGETFRVFGAGNGGIVTMNGMTASAATNSSGGTALLEVSNGGTIEATNSTLSGTNSGGALNGIHGQSGTNLVTLDDTQITPNSAGHGILVEGGSTTVTLTANSAITGFGSATDSLALVTGTGSLTLNATNSTLSGNVLADSTGTNAFTANLAGTTQWAGNVAANGGSTADVSLTDTAHWTGMATNATNVTIGSSAIWTMTGNSNATGALTFSTGNGTLQTTGSTPLTFTGNVVLDANGTFQTGADLTLPGLVSGSAGLIKTGAATLYLSGANSFAGGTTVQAGTAQATSADTAFGTGVLTVTSPGIAALNNFNTATGGLQGSGRVTLGTGTLTLNQDVDTTFSGVTSGSGGLIKNGSGTLTFSGNNTYTGATNVNAGTLAINGNNSAATGLVTVNSGGTLRGGEGSMPGSGTIGGSVLLNGGTMVTQDSNADGINKLTINGNLTVQNAANLNYNYGLSPNGNHDALMVEVGGTVNLNGGVVNVANTSGTLFDPGIYGLIHGTVNGSGLTLGSVTPADPNLSLQITADRVNLYNDIHPDIATYNFWNGTHTTPNGRVNGGTATWQGSVGAGAPTNWTTANGSLSGAFTDSSFAIFMGQPGTVTVDSTTFGPVRVLGMQFAVHGYTVQGAPITLMPDGNGNSIIRVGDGTQNGQAYTATISSELTGTAQLVKSDLGTLVLSGNNTYTGGTLIDAGVLQVSSNANLGDPSGALGFDGGILRVTGTSFTSTPRTITWGSAGGGFDIASAANTFTVSQALSGSGGLAKFGPGTLALTSANTYTGPTNVNAGTLLVNGSITSPTLVNPGATLGGIGTIIGNVTNAGTIVPGPGGNQIGALTIAGNYVGNNGQMRINTALGEDNSSTSQLILNGGAASGNTSIVVANQGGTGGQTTNGIPVVVAQNGASTTASSFSLGNTVIAGLYQYQLFRGLSGGTPDQQNSWFLRSHLDNGPNPPTPIYRPEGAMFASMPALGREMTRSAIGTFHDFNGDQGLTRGNGAQGNGLGRAWGRVYGEAIEQGHAGVLSPNFKGKAYGFQSGVDLFESETPDGFINRLGVFMGYAQARGEVRGFALGVQNNYVGDTSIGGLSGGAYWTRVGPRDEYLEARVLGTHYSGDGRSFANNINTNVKGTSLAASLEGGLPIRFGGFTLEPQAQLIYQYLDMTGNDPLSSIGYDTPDALYTRVGLRLASDTFFGMPNVRPYLKANLWKDAVGTDKTIFSATDVVDTAFRTTALEVGGGVVAQLNQNVGLWAMADYTTDIAGRQDRQIARGNLGVRIVW